MAETESDRDLIMALKPEDIRFLLEHGATWISAVRNVPRYVLAGMDLDNARRIRRERIAGCRGHSWMDFTDGWGRLIDTRCDRCGAIYTAAGKVK